uniref:hypothetical protein n=1 Tax=Burkholderia diffusa TaxID=488732 RepID=UPI001CC54453
MGRAEPARLHVDATGDVVYKRERWSGRERANPSSGAGHELPKGVKAAGLAGDGGPAEAAGPAVGSGADASGAPVR